MSPRAKSLPVEVKNMAADWIVRRDAGLTAAEELEFERWQAEDPKHGAALVHHDETWAVLDRPRRAGQSELMMQEFRARAARRRHRRRGFAAAALSVVLVAGIVWQSRRSVAPAATDSARAIVTVPEKRVLPDGSIVELKAGADVSVNFDGVLRRVALRNGEAHFQVAPSTTRPFVVDAGGIEVRAVGTAFAVQLGSKEVEVLVTHGRVAVDRPAGEAPSAMVAGTAPEPLATVNAGNLVVVNLGRDPIARPVVSAVPVNEIRERLAWRESRLEFTDAPLPEAIALMNRHSAGRRDVRFVLDDPALATVHVSGFFRADNSDTFVRMLEASFGVKAERAGNTITLRKAPVSPRSN